MPGVFIFTRSKDDPFTVFVGPYWHPYNGGKMANIEISNVNGLQAALGGKASTTHEHSWAQITGKPTTFPSSSHRHAVTEIDNAVGSTSIKTIWQGTQAAYDALTPASDALYIIKEA